MGQNKNDNTPDWWNKRYSLDGVHKIWSSKKRLQFYDMIATSIPKTAATILDICVCGTLYRIKNLILRNKRPIRRYNEV